MQQPIHADIRLYDLNDDLSESTDIAADHPDLVAKLRKLMDAAYEPSARWKFPREPGAGK